MPLLLALAVPTVTEFLIAVGAAAAAAATFAEIVKKASDAISVINNASRLGDRLDAKIEDPRLADAVFKVL